MEAVEQQASLGGEAVAIGEKAGCDYLANVLRVVRLDQVAKGDHERRQAPEAQLPTCDLGELAHHLSAAAATDLAQLLLDPTAARRLDR